MATEKQIAVARYISGMNPADGIVGDAGIETVGIPDVTSGEKIVDQIGNCYIWMRAKEGAGPVGARGVGRQNIGAIDLIAGLGGSDVNEKIAYRPNFGHAKLGRPGDNARVLISSKEENIDSKLGLVEGSSGMSSESSAVAVVADDVRIVSRRSTRLVTYPGGPNSRDSSSTEQNEIYGIDIIAGCKEGVDKVFSSSPTPGIKSIPYLQPMVKGSNLQDCLEEFLDNITLLQSELIQLILDFSSLATSLTTPYYIPGVPPSIAVNPNVQSSAVQLQKSLVSRGKEINNIIKKTEDLKTTYVNSGGRRSFLSKHNRVN